MSASVCFVLANKRVAIDFNQWALDDAGYPDGMCIDQEGKLWIAGMFSSKIHQFDPITGKYRLDPRFTHVLSIDVVSSFYSTS